jgi:hypothetical protein
VRRVLLIVFVVGLAIGFSSLALPYLSPYLSPSHFRASRPVKAVHRVDEADRTLWLQAEQESDGMAENGMAENRPVYPYSVVPGGVKDAKELKWAAAHDPVVAAHYAGFDYDHARVVRLVLARTVYVSYRIGNKIYWMRHRITLKKGETIITDGQMIARTRCANRVQEMPQQATSESEPPAAKFEEPIHSNTGTAIAGPPVPFQSALLNRRPAAGLGPAAPLSLVDPFGMGTMIPLTPPPLPGICGIGKNKNGSVTITKNKKKGNPCGNGEGGGGEVPEPSTWLLVASGLAVMLWTSRQRLARM